MDSHIRVYIEANWTALRCLQPMAYKVLICLVQRADGLGRCFPSLDRIAEDIDSNRQSVITALEQLYSERYIAYLRRDEKDLITGRQLPNVYLVNPHFICIALEEQNHALNLWASISNFEGKSESSDLTLTNNRNQHQKTNSIESKTKTNNNNQRTFEGVSGESPQKAESPGEKSKKPKKQKAKDQDNSESPEQQGAARQRSKKRGGSAAAYQNPDAIAAPIPDAPLENLAERVHQLGVPIALARGFVVGYGAALVETALLQVAAAKQRGQNFSNEAGFFRHLLQNNLVDSSIPKILRVQDSTWTEHAG